MSLLAYSTVGMAQVDLTEADGEEKKGVWRNQRFSTKFSPKGEDMFSKKVFVYFKSLMRHLRTTVKSRKEHVSMFFLKRKHAPQRMI